MQYFASVSAYTGIVARMQSKTKGNDQELTKYLINDCSSFWIIRVCELVYGLQIVLSLAQSIPWGPKNGPKVVCVSAETVQCLRSQNPYIIDANTQDFGSVDTQADLYLIC